MIDRNERTRLSEGEAARIWGACGEEEATQFYFAKRLTPFVVQEIIGGKKIQKHLETHRVHVGSELILESIAQVQEIHQPETSHITVSSSGGLRIYLTAIQAEQIIVKTAAQSDDTSADEQQLHGDG